MDPPASIFQDVTAENKPNPASIGAPAAIARSLVLQSLALWYRTPIKLFRPLRVDYLLMARAILPPPTNSRFSFQSTSLGMISHAVKHYGFTFIPRHILPPLIANSLIGGVLYTVYVSVLPRFHASLSYNTQQAIPPPFSAVFLSGALAGAAQSFVATPMDSLKVRFEVNDLLTGKHKSMIDYARTTWKELGWASIYRGFGLTLAKDSLSCGLFFGVFEFVKEQCYRTFISSFYPLSPSSTSSLSFPSSFPQSTPSPLLEPTFVLIAGGLAAISYHIVDHPLDKIRNVFLIEEAQAEFQHLQRPKLYKLTFEQCKIMASRVGWRKFLYGEFGGTVLRAVPATSVGFLVFEIMKRKIDQRYYGDDGLKVWGNRNRIEQTID
ncbi:337_t:CDS:2 [Paraglomus occultum]|uniref:337_t:CDS:1 n=1 Tax=Paraglomus occultum TaxID=144539 RepID=A0A9N9APV9_9GLOM|nr:337_t:CDS:2 [Paraglomus occultum]